MRPWLQSTSECLQLPDLLVSINLLKIDYGVLAFSNCLCFNMADLPEIRHGEITCCLYITEDSMVLNIKHVMCDVHVTMCLYVCL